MLVKEVLTNIVKNDKVFYYPIGGNAGDSLINIGFFQLAKDLNINYVIINKNNIQKLTSKDTVIISGGGSLVPEWGSTSEFIRHVINKGSRLIILPHSIRDVDELMKELPIDTIIFCREYYSYEYCKDIRPDLSIYIDNDMAFNCDVNEILNSNVKFKYFGYKNYIRLTIYLYHLVNSKKSNELHAFRCDKEANPSLEVKRLLFNDISVVASYGASHYESSYYSARKMLKILDKYEVIHTDRLHVSVAGYLLNKEVNIYNNSYFKCLGVYEKSMENNNKIKFHK
ncbi:polysaccharide pyruvyl transferase family protein [Psychrobacter celer]|uniref:polysaccharide pyruvyl transferase family protein n=1 Tax=Psychrobacter celer TaxID=306572 RepID=UPI003FD22329